MARSTTSLPLILALLLGGCTITIVPVPIRPADPNAVVVQEDTASEVTRTVITRRTEKPGNPAPPRIVVISPEQWAGPRPDALVLEPDQSVRIAGRVDYQGDVQSIRVNGEQVAAGGAADGVTPFVAVVAAPERGSRDVVVEAVAGGTTTSAVYVLRAATPNQPHRPGTIGRAQGREQDGAHGRERGREFGGPPAVTRALPPLADSAWALRERWALVIGVGDHARPEVPARQFAARDARAVEAFLRSDAAGPGGIPADRIRVLVDGDATRENVTAALSGFLSEADEDDVVLVYMTATGVSDPARPNAAYVLPYDGDPAAPAATAISVDWLAGALRDLRVHQKIVAAEFLYAGGRRKPHNPMYQALVPIEGPRQGGIVALTAAGGEAAEGRQLGGGQGEFTHHLLDGLGGAADRNADGVVTLSELVRHARQRVEGAMTGRQNPAIAGAAYDRDWPMAVVGGGAR